MANFTKTEIFSISWNISVFTQERLKLIFTTQILISARSNRTAFTIYLYIDMKNLNINPSCSISRVALSHATPPQDHTLKYIHGGLLYCFGTMAPVWNTAAHWVWKHNRTPTPPPPNSRPKCLREARIREIKKNGYLPGMNPRNREKDNILHLFISICFFCMFEL